MKSLSTKGDTIVEVIMALAVISAVISGAYVTANRSLNNTRQAQERGEALKYVEGQLERIKVFALTDASQTIFTTSQTFCFRDDNTIRLNTIVSPLPLLNNISDVLSGSNYDTLCIKNSRYYLAIERLGADPNFTFTANARWERVGGRGHDGLSIKYKVIK